MLDNVMRLLRKKEVALPLGLVLVLILGLALSGGDRDGRDGPPGVIPEPDEAITLTVEAAESYQVSFSRQFFWVGAESNESANMLTEGVVHRDGTYDLTVTSISEDAGGPANLSTESDIRVIRGDGQAALQLNELTRIHFAGSVTLEQAAEAQGIEHVTQWFVGTDEELLAATEALALRRGAVPIGDHNGVEYFEKDIVSLFADLASVSEVTSDVVEGSDRVRRYQIPQAVLGGGMSERIMTVLGTERPQGVNVDTAAVLRGGQISMWQDTTTGALYRIGFTTGGISEGLQVSVDYTLESIDAAPAVSFPQGTFSPSELRELAQQIQRLSEPTEFGLQEGHVRDLWLVLHEYQSGLGVFPSTEGVTVSVAESICPVLTAGGWLSECPEDPKPGGFYGYRSDGQTFVVTALLDDSTCAYEPSVPPNCQLNPSSDCEIILANTTVGRTEDGSCLYELFGSPGQLTSAL